MYEWLARSIIDGIDAYGNRLTYEKAMSTMKKKNPTRYDKIKEEVDKILISEGRADLISKK